MDNGASQTPLSPLARSTSIVKPKDRELPHVASRRGVAQRSASGQPSTRLPHFEHRKNLVDHEPHS